MRYLLRYVLWYVLWYPRRDVLLVVVGLARGDRPSKAHRIEERRGDDCIRGENTLLMRQHALGACPYA